MKVFSLLLVLSIFLLTSLKAQDKPAYRLFNHAGKEVKYSKMVKGLATSDMVFFGEYHTDPIAHWLQLELAKSLYAIKDSSLFFGAEMFENGNQLVLNEYLAGFYPDKKMQPEITQLWGNYATDYKPLVDFAKDKHLRFIATNIPRRYASMINSDGMSALDKLSPAALAMIGPDLKQYFDPTVKACAEMAEMMGGHVPPNMLNIQTAQASKDATMAHFSIINHREGDLMLHFEGSYHSNYQQGIVWWINKIKPGFDIKTIATVYAEEWELMSEEERNMIADYIIVVADGMTQTKR